MLKDLLTRIVGDPAQKQLKSAEPLLADINAAFEKLQRLSDDELKAKTQEFRGRLAAGETLDDLLPEAFAVVKDACRRLVGTTYSVAGLEQTWTMIPYDVQLLGGIVLHRGNIAEMKTGEGKTLVCTLPVYLNALAGKGVHVVTVNDYLAKRDAHWMGRIYEYLGLMVGAVVHGLTTEERRAAYAADITYGTNNEFGFDYLRDNMVQQLDQMVQRELSYAIVDEVDSILIDEARTPLIISAPAEESTSKYYQYSTLIPQLVKEEDYLVDEKLKTATLTEDGVAKMEKLLGMENIYTEAGFTEVHHIEQALRAHTLFQLDRDYIVKDGEVIIVDEFTGRLMPGRRYSDGLHQAIEAKEKVEVKRESRTLATITFQNYFRLYGKLAGMTGTAKTEEEEFYKIYGLEVVVIPTNNPIQRVDMPDRIFKNERGKFQAVARDIRARSEQGQPVLVGTISIERSEMLSEVLKREGVPHTVLNAKFHEQEAEIIARAGSVGAVTIATNMAGRGTDIKLGEGALERGGLHVLGTERHESRRIDNQLRGRTGRQGDPGSSQFYVSMQDDLMRLFGSERMQKMMDVMKIPEDEAIENAMISRSIESAQVRVEGHNFDIRKHVLEYDDVMNKQRTIIYARRRKMIIAEDVHEEVRGMIREDVRELVARHLDIPDALEDELVKELDALSPDVREADVRPLLKLEDREELGEKFEELFLGAYEKQAARAPSQEIWRNVEKAIYLRTLDSLWMEHIDTMAHLRDAVSLSGYGQRDPLIEYKSEGFQLFDRLVQSIRRDTVRTLFRVEVQAQNVQQLAAEVRQPLVFDMQTNEEQIAAQSGGGLDARAVADELTGGHEGHVHAHPPKAAPAKAGAEIGRNDPCPCGSGKKFKKCHGK